MVTSKKPLVSIGLALYNAGENTRRILDNLLAFDYPNIEILISDNASTDETWEICREYSENDERLRLSRNDKNRGYLFNFARVFEMATGPYFMWAAHDDWWDPHFASFCVAKLEEHPEAVLCYTDQMFKYLETGVAKEIEYAGLHLDAPSVSTRIRNLLKFRPHPHALFYGMFRRERILEEIPQDPIPSADISFLIRVMLLGTGVHVPKILYEREVAPSVDFRARMAMLRPGESIPSNFVIVCQTLFTLLGYIGRSSTGILEKIRMAFTVSGHVVTTYGIYIPPSSVKKLLGRVRAWVER